MISTTLVTVGTISDPLFISNNSIISVKAVSGGTCVVEYTTGTAIDIRNNVATWAAWPKGTVTSGATFADLAVNELFIRLKPTVGTATLTVNDSPNAVDMEPYNRDFSTSPVPGIFSTGSFTTLAATSTVSGAGFSTYMAAPPSIGTTTPGIVKTSNLQMVFTDSSGTPGNVTNNSPRGKVSFAALATTIVVTNSLVSATSSVIAGMNVTDGALTGIISCIAGAGTITITGNAAATTAGLAKCNFVVFN